MGALFWKAFWAPIVPLGPAVLAVLLWWGWGKVDVAIETRRAVKIAVERLVAGERIAGLEATIEAKTKVATEARNLRLQEQQMRAAAEQHAEQLRAEAVQYELERQDLDDQIAELLARPVADACTVDRALLDRLRAN